MITSTTMGKHPKRLIRIGEAAALMGVSVQTMRKWERTGELRPTRKSQSGTRYYDRLDLLDVRNESLHLRSAMRAYPAMTKRPLWTDSTPPLRRTVRPRAGAPKSSATWAVG